MNEYFFLASLLPPLEIGHVPALGYVELKELLKVNLSDDDLKSVEAFFRQIDFENIRSFWAVEPLDPRGNLNAEEIEQALLDYSWPGDEEFPPFLVDFLNKHHSNEDRLATFSFLLSDFYDHAAEEHKGFLRSYFHFQKEWRLVLLGFRAKLLEKDIAVELQYEDETDPFIAQLLAQKDAKGYEPPFDYKDLKPVFEHHQENPLELHKALYEYQFNHMIELWGGELFTINRILNYMARLIIVERWLELDMQKGIEVIDEIERKVT